MSATHERGAEGAAHPRAAEALVALLAPDVRRALLLGTTRSGAVPPHPSACGERDPARWPHAAAAMAAVARGFARPPLPAWRAGGAAPRDPRPRVPDAARAALVRLVTHHGPAHEDELVLAAIAHALVRAGVALHPFDCAPLARLVRARDFRPGPIEAAWLAFDASLRIDDRATASEAALAAREPQDSEALDTAPVAVRVAALRLRRAQDAAGGRALVEAALAGESAAARARLVGALEDGLSGDDTDLLARLCEDRSQAVRDAAAKLLARLPGTPEAAARITEAAASLTTGPKLGLAVPEKARKSGSALFWALETFADVGLDDLAAALGLSAEALVSRGAGDPVLETVLLACALEDAERARDEEAAAVAGERLRARAARLTDADWAPLLLREAAREHAPPAHASVLAVLDPAAWSELPAPHALAAMHAAARGPLAPRLARAIATCAATARFLEHLDRDDRDDRDTRAAAAAAPMTFAALAALCRGHAREALARAPLALTARASTLLEVLEALDATGGSGG